MLINTTVLYLSELEPVQWKVLVQFRFQVLVLQSW